MESLHPLRFWVLLESESVDQFEIVSIRQEADVVWVFAILKEGTCEPNPAR
jgi:hypothetical protein